MDKSTSCGLLSWRPQFLQRFASRKTYLFIYSLLGIVQGMGSSYLTTVLSTIEKQFGIKSSETAWIFSGNEFSQIFFILLLPFLPKIKKRTMWTSIAMISSSLGIFLCAMPFFLRPQSDYAEGWNLVDTSSEEEALCTDNPQDQQDCLDDNKGKSISDVVLIFVGFFITGFGTSFYYSFGVPYIDDNMPRQSSPFAIGILTAARTIGPALGSFLGSACLSIYVVPGLDVGLKEGEPGWLGAWWLGFLVIAVLVLCIAPFLAWFPERLPGSEETDASRLEASKANSEAEEPKTVKEYLEETKIRVVRLARNKMYVLSSCSTVFFLFGIIGFGTFIPKLFEYGFRQKSTTTGSASGGSQQFATAVGVLFSGYLVGRFKFRARTLQIWNIIVTFTAVFAFFTIFQLQCPTDLTIYEGACDTGCVCKDSVFDPVCSEDGVTMFLSPCKAGCRSSSKIAGEGGKELTLYTDCGCVEQASLALNATRAEPWWRSEDDLQLPSPISDVRTIDNDVTNGGGDVISSAVEGFCPGDCDSLFYVTLGLFGLLTLVGSTARVGSTLINLRCVDPSDKAASMVIMVSILSLVAFLPAPLIMGAIIDGSCVVWGQKCGKRTTCLLYDVISMKRNAGYFVATNVMISGIFETILLFNIRGLKIFDEDEGEDDSAEMKTTKEKKEQEVLTK